jgi:predicted metal-dependent peptidase
LQLFNIGCFSVLKQLYRKQIERFIQNRVNYINKQDFLEVYYIAYTETINPANIYSSFATAELVLYNPERILSKLYTQLKIPTLLLATAIEQEPWVPEI